MAKVNKVDLIIEVQSRPALWREDHANFGRRDLTDKLWEEVAISCNILNGQVSSAKKLRGGVQFVEAIPKNPSGKILRKELRGVVSPKSKL
uniref:MADF domain-containing protein n=1 Tax=Timema douglasi TaxID=61478 RepID=A0A7R8VPB4_TIMDO|nr:unnamed protein product [Timema douglasi]